MNYLYSSTAMAHHEQSVVCVAAISMCKAAGIITYRDFNSDEAKKCMSNWSSKEDRIVG
jgi:hypothetical protein